MKKKTVIFLILILSFFLRTVNIQTNPPALYGDELTITLDAYSLLKTGHDQLGNLLPLTFAMGAGRPAGYVYGAIPLIAIFGPSPLGVRALSILSGIGVVLLLYFISRRICGEKVAIISAGLGAISPWEISLSRGGFEAHFALFLALLGVYLLMLARQKPMFYIFSAIAFGLTIHTYPTYKISLLLFLPLLFWYQGGKNLFVGSKKHLIAAVVVLIIFGILSISQTFIGGSEVRFFNINIFSQKELKASIEQKINLERQMSGLPKQFVKLFHNKPAEYSKVFMENYLSNFSLDFLVLHGDRNPRHNMVTMGELYFIEIILIVIAILAFWQKKRKLLLFLLGWIVLVPVPVAIVDLPHALRSSFMLPPLVMLSAMGLGRVWNYRSRIPLYLVILFFLVQFIFLIQKLYFLSPNEYSSFWSYPARVASNMAIENKDQYKFIILSSKIESIEFAYPVYAQIAPEAVINQNKNNKLLGYPMKQFDNIYIGNILDSDLLKVVNTLPGSVLYIGSRYEAAALDDYEKIDGLDGQTALVVKKKR